MMWHENTIPEDEVWIKVGADHVGGSFKITLQIANVRNPNSKLNTCLLLVADCKDSPENLRKLFDPYRDQLA